MCNWQGHVLTMRMNLPVKNASNRAKYGGEMSEIHSILMIFMKLIVSHSILHRNLCSLVRFKGCRFVNCHMYTSKFLPVTHMGKLYLCISLVIREILGFLYLHGSRIKIPASIDTGSGYTPLCL